MCEETDREGRGLENKWIYVLLLFAMLGGQWHSLLFYILKYIKMSRAIVAVVVRVNSNHLKLIKR